MAAEKNPHCLDVVGEEPLKEMEAISALHLKGDDPGPAKRHMRRPIWNESLNRVARIASLVPKKQFVPVGTSQHK